MSIQEEPERKLPGRAALWVSTALLTLAALFFAIEQGLLGPRLATLGLIPQPTATPTLSPGVGLPGLPSSIQGPTPAPLAVVANPGGPLLVCQVAVPTTPPPTVAVPEVDATAQEQQPSTTAGFPTRPPVSLSELLATPTPMPLTSNSPTTSNQDGPAELILFGIVALGIFGNWFWIAGWDYVRNPRALHQFGPWRVVSVRLLLCLIAAALTFVPTYDKLDQNTRHSLVAYLVAFQMGFFWQSAFHAVINPPALSRSRPRLNRATP